jgi:hypothetical protein
MDLQDRINALSPDACSYALNWLAAMASKPGEADTMLATALDMGEAFAARLARSADECAPAGGDGD